MLEYKGKRVGGHVQLGGQVQLGVHFEVDTTMSIRFIRKLLYSLRDYKPALQDIMKNFTTVWVVTQFSAEGGILSTKWAPLSPEYAKWKASHYFGKQILVRTGAMRTGAISPTTDVTYTKKSVTKLLPTDYAIFHQMGTWKMPKRPLVKTIPDYAIRKWELMIVKFIEKFIKEIV